MKRMGPAGRAAAPYLFAILVVCVLQSVAAGLHLAAGHAVVAVAWGIGCGVALGLGIAMGREAAHNDGVLRGNYREQMRELLDKETFGGFRRH
jgi:hypothetical protein